MFYDFRRGHMPLNSSVNHYVSGTPSHGGFIKENAQRKRLISRIFVIVVLCFREGG
jgi:hypothetical protein